ncbi:MAG: hypothetical protein LQ338_007027 [Usnochroma carphineum]|nr:MAG: hypothetical protein LQ338_007027 [Usnochroma carphineum]
MAPSIVSWDRDSYLISSDPSLLVSTCNHEHARRPSVGSAEKLLAGDIRKNLVRILVPWPLQEDRKCTTDEPPVPEQVGLIRTVTDHATFVCLADVVIVAEEQGKGLGRWLLQCADEIVRGLDTTLKRVILFCREGPLEKFYEKELGMARWGPEAEGGLLMMHREGQASGVEKIGQRSNA